MNIREKLYKQTVFENNPIKQKANEFSMNKSREINSSS
jgi:hypothetical protein